MQSETHVSLQDPLEDLVHLLADEVRSARQEARRQRRRLRTLAVALTVALTGGGWAVLQALPVAEAQEPLPARAVPAPPEERAARHAELLSMLPADKQRELVAFEREVDWLTRYMQTWDEGKAGAVVAIMLFRMAQSMDTMPSMEQQMRTMSTQMSALPAIVAELNQINAKMHVITTTMDSTMGRAGRMMPWMPFSP